MPRAQAIAARIEAAVEGLVLEPFDDDEFPEELPDRAADIWEPLLALGRAAGPGSGSASPGTRPSRSARARRGQPVGAPTAPARHPDRVRQRQQGRRLHLDPGGDRTAGGHAQQRWEASGLCAIEDGPWVATSRTRRPITPHMFWKLITGYDIPKVSTGQVRGMRPSDFADAFARYLPKADGPAPR